MTGRRAATGAAAATSPTSATGGRRPSAPAAARALALLSTALLGCATRQFSMHSLPPETPAADNAAAIKSAAVGMAEGAGGSGQPPGGESFVPMTLAEAPSMYTYDPLERMNRFMYRFNARFDEAIFLPAANGYRRIPTALRSAIHNFFANLTEPDSVVNYGLQARFVNGIRSLGRFVINSTIGIGGLFDVATRLQVQSPSTGFSSTLGTWGFGPGPFLVLPLLGPSTLRDGVGYLGDYGLSYGINVADLYRGNKTYALSTVNAIDQRANVSFRYYATGSPFEYETIRFLYVRKRLIEDLALRSRGKGRRPQPAAPQGR